MNAAVAIVISSIVVLGVGVAISFWVGKRNKGIEDWNVGGDPSMYVVAGTQFATGMGEEFLLHMSV